MANVNSACLLKRLVSAALLSLAIVFSWLLCAPFVAAQQGAVGTIVGSITDPSGSAVPGASVTATNEGTQFSRAVVTDNKGTYQIPLLNPGSYTVRAEKQGFATAVSKQVVVQVNQSTRADFQVKLGTVTETVEVKSEVPLLQTTNATVGHVISTQTVSTLPLNGRDFLSLATLTPGAAVQEGNSGRTAQTGKYAGANQPVIAGNRQDSSTITLDGFLDARPYDVTPVVRPTIDAIQEFKIEDSNFTAEEGRNPAAVTIVTKSGTNALHGAAWDFLRNDVFDARQYFDKTVAPLRRNQFGALLSGPVVIPHIYNGKNKTFFMFDWESARFRIGTTESGNYLNPAFLRGDFSSLTDTLGNKIQLYNPFTTNAATGQRQPFVNNQIPLNLFDPVALKMAQMFEATPNTPGFPNTVATIVSPEDNNQYTGRIDHQFGKNSLMGRFSYVHDNEHDISLQPWGGQYGINTDIQTGIRWTRAIRPTLLNEARIGFLTGRTYLEQEAVQANKNLNAESGIKNITFFPPFSYSVPLVSCVGSLYSCPAGGQSFKEISNVLEYGDTLTWVHGSHNTAFGTTIYRSRNVWASGGATGNYVFNGQYTAQQGPGFVAVPGTGDSVADFLLGQTVFAGVTSAGGNGDYLDTYYSIFAQDGWRVTPNLTLNLGVNWQYSGPYMEKYGRETFPDFSAQAKSMGGRQLNNCNPQYAYNPVYNPGNNFGTIIDPALCIKDFGKGAREYYDFQPRLGLAYRVRANTVVRTGFGLFFNNPQWASEMAGMSGDPPFPLFASLNSTTFTTSQYPLDALFPPFSQMTAQTTGRDVGPTLLGRRMPYTYEWNLSVQHEFTANNLLELGYIGSASHHLQILDPINQAVPDRPGVTTPVVSRLPYPNFGGIGGLAVLLRGGNANYNAGFVQFQRRFSRGISALANFTWAHDLGWNGEQNFYVAGGPSTPIQNANCLPCDYGNIPQDVPYRFSVSGTYQLPFGHGKPFLSQGIGAAIFGGWQLNGIGSFQSGVPISCFDTRDTANVGFSGRCNYAPGRSGQIPSQNFQSTGFAFDPSAFALRPQGDEFGNSGPNVLRTGKVNNIDLSLFKDFPLGEAKTLQFRAEFFNAFNITQFITPVNSITDPNFGKYVPSPTTGIGGLNPSGLTAPSVAPAREIQLALKLVF